MDGSVENETLELANIILRITVSVEKAKGKKVHKFVAKCLQFELFSYGNSEEEAVALLRENVGLFIDACKCNGTIQEVLKKSGYKNIDSFYRTKCSGNYLRVVNEDEEFVREWNDLHSLFSV